MQKIPTLFQRDDNHKVIDMVTLGCEWVLAGEGVATEKLDGTNVRLTIRSGGVVRVEKRRNPRKEQKARGIIDGWYEDALACNNADRHILDAVKNTDPSGWPDGEHPCEAIGPKIQSNPLRLQMCICVPFMLTPPRFFDTPRTYEGLRSFAFPSVYYGPIVDAEGIVFHHPDGRMAKIKRKDFS